MAESLASIIWQETVDAAVSRLEEKTGLSLEGLSQLEISLQVREWMKAKAESRLQSESGSEVQMTARGVDFLEGWIATNVTSAPKEPDEAGVLAAKLLAEAAVSGFTLADMDLDEDTVEDYIRNIIVHVGLPGTPGD